MEYKIFKHNMKNSDVGVYESYGISYRDIKIPDISIEYDNLKDFVDKLNRNQADILHIYSLIEDYYYDNV